MSTFNNGESGASVRTKINNAISATFPEITATGSISTGDTVALRSDGTVEVVASSSAPRGIGSPVDTTESSSSRAGMVYDPASGKVLLVYRQYPTNDFAVILGDVSGNTITFGSPTTIHTTSDAGNVIGAAIDAPTGKVVIAWEKGSIGGSVIVGAISGSTVSFGAPVDFTTNRIHGYNGFCYDSTNNKVVIAYRDQDDLNRGKIVSGEVSSVSNTVTMGTPYLVTTDAVAGIAVTHDPVGDHIVVAHAYSTGVDISLLSHSGTSFSFDDTVQINTVSSADVALVYDSANDKAVVFYREGGTRYGYAAVLTISGGTVTDGTRVQFFNTGSKEIDSISAIYASDSSEIIVTYRFLDSSNLDEGMYQSCTVSGTTPVFSSPANFMTGAKLWYNALGYMESDNTVLIAYSEGSSIPYDLKVVVFPLGTTNTNADDFIGFAQNDAADTEPVAIATSYTVDHTQTGLTPMQTYWVDVDGTLSTSDTGYPVAGYALTATQLRVGG